MSQESNRWDAYVITDYDNKQGGTKARWTKIGAGFTNRDGSISVLLDAFPVGGKLILQIPMTQEEKKAKFGETGNSFRQQAQQQGDYAPRQQRQAAAPGQRGQGQYQRPQQGAQRFQQASAPPYQPDAEGPQDGPWTLPDGTQTTDARTLPPDHPDHVPF